jgi:uncharacterized protein
MKTLAILRRALPLVPIIACAALLAAQSPGRTPARDYAIRPVPFFDVTVDDAFWAPRLERNRTVSIPHIMRENERTGRVANFEKAAGLKKGEYEGRRFNDSDIYKTIEAAAYTLKTRPDPALESQLAHLVDLVARAQVPDGYLYPARTLGAKPPVAGIGAERWINLNGSHELYNVGHLYEAAIAWQLATGRDDFMRVASKNADLVNREFGPTARKAVPGHEEIELALVKMYRLTGDERYFTLARFFLDQRGRPHDTQPYPPDSPFAIYNDRPYMQDHLPVTAQTRAIGHAVRAMYLYSAMTDVAGLAQDVAYRDAVDRIWTDMVSKRMYVTGGIGSRGVVEAFGDDYELPNKEAYTETCASVGNDLWNERMFLLHGDGKYVDVLERVLYNGLLSGVSASGDRFFYQNPLESAGDVERSEYFEVACCPSNLARLLAQFPGLIYATGPDRADGSGDILYVNLFVGSTAHVALSSTKVTLVQETQYPWDGRIRITVKAEKAAEFALHVRVPGWAREQPVPSDLYRFVDRRHDEVALSVNGKSVPVVLDAGFARIRRRWSPGDVVELDLPMPVRRLVAHAGVKADRGRAAIERGPIVYAVEAADNDGRVSNLVLPLSVVLQHEFRPSLLGGIGVVTGPGTAVDDRGARKVQVTAIPYYAWANRGKGEMAVWVPYNPEP